MLRTNNNFLSDCLPSCFKSQYASAGKHYDAAFKSSSWSGRAVHALICFIEVWPIIGTIVYCAEAYLFSNTKTTNSRSSSTDSHAKTNHTISANPSAKPDETGVRKNTQEISSFKLPAPPRRVFTMDSLNLQGVELALAKALFSYDKEVSQIELVAQLGNKIAPKELANTINRIAPEALEFAFSKNKFALAKWLLKHGVNPNMTYTTREWGEETQKPVLTYLSGYHFLQLNEYLDNTVDISAETASYLLREAIFFHISMQTFNSEQHKILFANSMQLLLDRGAEGLSLPNVSSEYRKSALAMVIEMDISQGEFPNDLLDKLADSLTKDNVNVPIKGTGETALDLAKAHNRHNLVLRLINLGAQEKDI